MLGGTPNSEVLTPNDPHFLVSLAHFGHIQGVPPQLTGLCVCEETIKVEVLDETKS